MLETKESLGFLGFRHHSSKHLVRPIFPDGSPSEIIDGENVYHHLLTLKTFPGCEGLFSDYILPFTSGGTHEVVATDTLTGATSGATCVVVSVHLDSGSWAGADAAGYFFVNTISGTFQSENLNEGANPDVCTIAAAPIPAQLGSTNKRRCVGAFPYIDGNGNYYLILCYPDRIYKFAPGGTSPIEITGSVTLSGTNVDYFDSTYWVDTSGGYNPWIIMVNGVNPPIYWTGSGNCQTLAGSPPTGKYISAFAGHCFISNVTSGATYTQRDQRSDVDEADDWSGGFAGSNDLRQSDGAITGSLVFGDLRFVFKEYNCTICRSTGYDPPLLYEQDELPVGCIAPKTLIKVWRHDYGFFMGNDLNMYLVAKDGSFIAIGDNITYKIREWSNDDKLRYSFAVYFPKLDHIVVGIPTTDHASNFCDRLLAFDLGHFLETGEKIWSAPINTGINFSAGTVLRFRQAYKIQDLSWVSSDGTIGGLDPDQIKDLFSEAAFSEIVMADNNGYVFRFDEDIEDWNGTTCTWQYVTKDYRLTNTRLDQFRLQEYELDYENPVNANATAQVEISTDGGGNYDAAISLSLSVGEGNNQQELSQSAFTDKVGKKFRFRVSGTYPLEIHGQRFHGTNEGRY